MLYHSLGELGKSVNTVLQFPFKRKEQVAHGENTVFRKYRGGPRQAHVSLVHFLSCLLSCDPGDAPIRYNEPVSTRSSLLLKSPGLLAALFPIIPCHLPVGNHFGIAF